MPDHIHLLISFKPKYAPTNIVKAFKRGLARMFFEKHPEIKAQKFWVIICGRDSYYISTLDNMSRETVQN